MQPCTIVMNMILLGYIVCDVILLFVHCFSAKLGKPQMPKGHQAGKQKTKTSDRSKLPQRNLAAKYYGIQPQSWPDSQ